MEGEPIFAHKDLDQMNGIKKAKAVFNQYLKDTNNVPINNVAYKTIPLVIVSWLLAQILSTWNYGGNDGNIQAGIIYSGILLTPYMLKIIRSWRRIELNERLSKTGLIFILIFSISLSVHASEPFIKRGSYISREMEYAQELNSRKIGKYPFYVDGNAAMIAHRAGIKSINSFQTPIHMSQGKETREKSIEQFAKFIENNNLDKKLEYFTQSSIKDGSLFYHPNDERNWLKDMLEVKREECFQSNGLYCHGELLIKKSR